MQRQAQIDLCLRKIRRERDRAAIGVRRLGKSPHRALGAAERVPVEWAAFGNGERLAHQRQRAVVTACLVMDDSEQVQSVGVPRIAGEHGLK